MNCRLVDGNSCDTVEKQSFMSRTINILWQHNVTCRMYLNYVSTMSQLYPNSGVTVEKQSYMSCTTNMQITLKQHSVTWQMYLNYLSTISQPWSDKWRR